MNTGPLRGLVTHILPRYRRIEAAQQDAIDALLRSHPARPLEALRRVWTAPDRWVRISRLPRTKGLCRWCSRPLPRQSNRWDHWLCKRMMKTDLAGPEPWDEGYEEYHAEMERPRREPACEECGDTPGLWMLEADHRKSLAVAWMEGGADAWVRANFCDDNIRWLCRKCHREKTASDFAEMARLRQERIGNIVDKFNQLEIQL